MDSKVNNKVLIIEDDSSLLELVISSFKSEGFTCTGISNGTDAMADLSRNCYDLIVMDLDLGDINGKEIIDLMRKQSFDQPIIVMSTYSSINTKVELFNIGCDDYITKPFIVDELLIRSRRLLKRCRVAKVVGEQILTSPNFNFGNVDMNYLDSTVVKDGETIKLTKKLFEMLSFFISHQDQIVTKDTLVSRFWDGKDVYIDNTLSVHIHKLRNAIEEDPNNPVYLTTKRGQGYIFSLKNNL